MLQQHISINFLLKQSIHPSIGKLNLLILIAINIHGVHWVKKHR